MVEINGKKYKLCLFDTNALSSFLQKPKEWIIFFNQEFQLSETIICYSIFTLSELFYRQELFEKYIDIFSSFPSAILDGHESIFKKEIQTYRNRNNLNPIVLTTFSNSSEGLSRKKELEKVIKESEFYERTKYWKKGQEDILEGMVQLIKNYPPKKGKYTVKEINEFNFQASNQQIKIHDKSFARKVLDHNNHINIDWFLSLKSTSYVVFYKFYPDNRKPLNSDVFDIIISSLLPYVDSFLTEGNLYDIIVRIQKKHDFLRNVKPYKLKEILKQMDNYS